jgi:hypothetical protein
MQITTLPSQYISGGDAAKQIILGANALLDYILYASIDHPSTPDRERAPEDAGASQPDKQPLKKLFL